MEDDFDQKNKKHNATRNKLAKRWKQQKEVAKEKKKKKKNYDRDEQKEKFFHQKLTKKEKDEYGINLFKLKKNIKKFLNIFEDDIEDFYAIFKSLDSGEEVDISEIENKQTKKYLSKIFKKLKLKSDDLNFKKKSSYKIKDLSKYVQIMVEQIKIEESEESSSSDSENDDDSEPQPKKQIKKNENQEIANKKDELISKFESLNQQTQQQMNEKQEQSEVNSNSYFVAKVQKTAHLLMPHEQNKADQQQVGPSIGPSIGPSMGPSIGPSIGPQGPPKQIGPIGPSQDLNEEQEEPQQEIPEEEQTERKDPKRNPNREEWMFGDWKDLGKKINPSKNKLQQYLTKRIRPTEEKKGPVNKNIYAEGSATLEESNQMSQEEFLMEEHQEMQALKAQNDPRKAERSRFNYEKDISFNKIDSKRLFAAMKETDALNGKFVRSKIEKNFQ